MDDFMKSREKRRLSKCVVELDQKLQIVNLIRDRVAREQKLLKKQRQLVLPEISEIIKHRRYLLSSVPAQEKVAYSKRTKMYRKLHQKVEAKIKLQGVLKDLMNDVLYHFEMYLKVQKERVQADLNALAMFQGYRFAAKWSCSCILAAVLIYWIANTVFF